MLPPGGPAQPRCAAPQPPAFPAQLLLPIARGSWGSGASRGQRCSLLSLHSLRYSKLCESPIRTGLAQLMKTQCSGDIAQARTGLAQPRTAIAQKRLCEGRGCYRTVAQVFYKTCACARPPEPRHLVPHSLRRSVTTSPLMLIHLAARSSPLAVRKSFFLLSLAWNVSPTSPGSIEPRWMQDFSH